MQDPGNFGGKQNAGSHEFQREKRQDPEKFGIVKIQKGRNRTMNQKQRKWVSRIIVIVIVVAMLFSVIGSVASYLL